MIYRLMLTLCFLAVTCSANGQEPASLIKATISLLTPQLTVGEEAWVYLTIRNTSSLGVPFPSDVKVYLKGEHGEPPTTLRERQLTHRLRLGERELKDGGFENIIGPNDTFTRKYKLNDLYDLSVPGKYSVVLTISDDYTMTSGHIVVYNHPRWLESNRIELKLESPK